MIRGVKLGDSSCYIEGRVRHKVHNLIYVLYMDGDTVYEHAIIISFHIHLRESDLYLYLRYKE